MNEQPQPQRGYGNGAGTLTKSFPARIKDVKIINEDAVPHDGSIVPRVAVPCYAVKASSDGAEVDQRASVHFTLYQEDGAPRVGGFITITIEIEEGYR